MNWDAASVGVALATFALGQFFSWWGGRRSAVVYTHHSLSAPLGGIAEFVHETLGKRYENHIYADQFEFENKGRHISDFSVRIKKKNILSYNLSKTSSIDEDDIEIKENQKGNMIISIPDLPAGEKVSIDIFSFSYSGSYDALAGGSSKFVLKEIGDYRARRVGFMIGSIAAATVAFFAFRFAVGG
ncbi:hypothetical protein V6U71_09045 [Sphingopyxis sp. J-6]|uniref:hypothetical protein n=1 Tax=Sphingopyxis sp. J-6 TaxID=3122054 RepID=UPI0039842B5C